MTERTYHPYTEWEDYKAGMYRLTDKDPELINKALDVLRNPLEAMDRVVNEWPVSCIENLSIGSKSWLGQAACCIAENVPEHLTRIAWNTLTKPEQDNANRIASQIIEQWQRTTSN